MPRSVRLWPSDFSAAESLLNDVLGDMPFMLYSMDFSPPKRVVFVSSNVLTRLGFSPAEVLGDWRNWLDRVHGDDQDLVARSDNQPDSAYHESIEYRVLHKNGNWVWIRDEFRVKPAGPTDRLVRFGYWTDISRRKSVELQLRASEYELRQLLEERSRLSRDLHDGIVQTLYAIGLMLEEARRVLFENPQSGEEIITHAIGTLNTVIREVRQHITLGGMHVLSQQQLRTELSCLSQMLGGMNRLRFRFELDSAAVASLSMDASYNVLQIIREAMSNSLRHSGGTSGLVALRNDGGTVRVVISDNGVGFDPKRRANCGLGLQNIATRAAELGATLYISSHVNGGTVLTIEIPGAHAKSVT
jgi:signal transduction histidine kinase